MTKFKTRARIIHQLGYQLIKSESIALLELIKNSYDADASFCRVEMSSVDKQEIGKIVILDDGEGMDENILSNVWLELGTSYKEDLANEETTKRTSKYRRLRLGEKGIGRLGVHRLGQLIRITTRRSESEHVLTIDWDEIEKNRYLEDVPVNIITRKPKVFIDKSGTELTIQKLSASWTKKMIIDCHRTITSLNSPFEGTGSFRAELILDNKEWIKGLLTFEDIESYKLFAFDVLIDGNEIQRFKYEFTPWETMKKLSNRCITHKNTEMRNLKRMVENQGLSTKDIDLGKYKIGPVRFKGIIFDRDTRTLDLGVQDKKGLKTYLDKNGGIRVYRDNMRVLDYGEPGNDWLDLDGRRVNIPAKRISNNIVLGAVYLDRGVSEDLKEKANREGFIENEAYYELFSAIRYVIDKVETFRKQDKNLLRIYYGPQQVSEPVITSITDLKDVVEKNVKVVSAKKDIYRYLDRIESEYEQITESLMKSAGAGLNLVIVIHQIDKIIKNLKIMLRKNASSESLLKHVEDLSVLVEGYSILVKKSQKKVRNLKGIIEQAVFNLMFRLEAHNIKLNAAYETRTKNLDAWCSNDHVVNALMNLVDNSIWWLDYSRINNPEIYLDISDALQGYVSILVADNGHGFSLPTEEIVKPFISNKPDGMGIGLHLTLQIMISLGGKLLFPQNDYFDFPAKFKSGAKIILAFKTGDRSK